MASHFLKKDSEHRSKQIKNHDCVSNTQIVKCFIFAIQLFTYIYICDGMINRNRLSKILGVFLESVSESEEVGLFSHLANDSS